MGYKTRQFGFPVVHQSLYYFGLYSKSPKTVTECIQYITFSNLLDTKHFYSLNVRRDQCPVEHLLILASRKSNQVTMSLQQLFFTQLYFSTSFTSLSIYLYLYLLCIHMYISLYKLFLVYMYIHICVTKHIQHLILLYSFPVRHYESSVEFSVERIYYQLSK